MLPENSFRVLLTLAIQPGVVAHWQVVFGFATRTLILQNPTLWNLMFLGLLARVGHRFAGYLPQVVVSVLVFPAFEPGVVVKCFCDWSLSVE